MSGLFSLAFSLFVLMDAVGNIPLYISNLKNVSVRRQPWVILREMLIALVVIFLFAFFGDGLMNLLGIGTHTIQIAGGLILFLLCLKMVFPKDSPIPQETAPEEEPLVVPLAIPLIAGPALLAAVMVHVRQGEVSSVLAAILIAWFASLLVLLLSPLLRKLLGLRGIIAVERLMGLIMILIAVEMFLQGVYQFLHHGEMASAALL